MENCDTHQNGNWVLLFNLGWAIGRMVGAPVELGDPPTKTAQRFYSPLAGESNLLADLVGGSRGVSPALRRGGFEEVGLWVPGRMVVGRDELGDPPTKTATRF